MVRRERKKEHDVRFGVDLEVRNVLSKRFDKKPNSTSVGESVLCREQIKAAEEVLNIRARSHNYLLLSLAARNPPYRVVVMSAM